MRPLLTNEEALELAKSAFETQAENDSLKKKIITLSDEVESLRKALKYVQEALSEDGELIQKLSSSSLSSEYTPLPCVIPYTLRIVKRPEIRKIVKQK